MYIFINLSILCYFDVYIHQNTVFRISLDQLGQQIKALRKERHWSQQQLADMAGLDRTTLGMLERNSYNDIGIRKVQRVLELLNRKLAIEVNSLPTLDELVQQVKK